uniref:Uncharacterized protein n=1 Tax=Burkholderia sp. M701 TaxID=326454 RepID=V5YNU5_9BURK|nr:hypothetical protein [Burkholderia sp. M701]
MVVGHRHHLMAGEVRRFQYTLVVVWCAPALLRRLEANLSIRSDLDVHDSPLLRLTFLITFDDSSFCGDRLNHLVPVSRNGDALARILGRNDKVFRVPVNGATPVIGPAVQSRVPLPKYRTDCILPIHSVKQKRVNARKVRRSAVCCVDDPDGFHS